MADADGRTRTMRGRGIGLRGLCAASAVVATVLVGCGSTEEAPDPLNEGRSLLPEDPAALPEMDPPTFRALLRELRGTPVVVNVWATWCPPCVEEAPDLATVSRELGGQVQFIGLDILDERTAARKFIREYGWSYPSIFDPSGMIRDDMGYIGQPVTLIYDWDGTLAYERVGAIHESILRNELGKLL